MNAKSAKLGFTLIEILVATAIIVMIVSMVYGSYLATSQSTEIHRLNLDTTQNATTTLEQISQQIRCCYAGKTVESRKDQTELDIKINFFSGDLEEPTGEILHLITTKPILTDSINGLFDITYKFDRSTNALLVSERIFTGSSKSITTQSNWQLFATNISELELAFCDGKKWLKNWNYERQKILPSAVKVGITVVDKNHRQHRYSTIAAIYCQTRQVTLDEQLLSKQQ